jgi:hypothetical protein
VGDNIGGVKGPHYIVSNVVANVDAGLQHKRGPPRDLISVTTVSALELLDSNTIANEAQPFAKSKTPARPTAQYLLVMRTSRLENSPMRIPLSAH